MNPVSLHPTGPARVVENAEQIGLRQAAERFEALFVQMLIQRMREAQLEEGFFGRQSGASVYEGMLDHFLSSELTSDSPLGIADLLVRQWSWRTGEESETEGGIGRLEALTARRAYEALLADLPPDAPGVPRIPPDPPRTSETPKVRSGGDKSGSKSAVEGAGGSQVRGLGADERNELPEDDAAGTAARRESSGDRK